MRVLADRRKGGERILIQTESLYRAIPSEDDVLIILVSIFHVLYHERKGTERAVPHYVKGSKGGKISD